MWPGDTPRPDMPYPTLAVWGVAGAVVGVLLGFSDFRLGQPPTALGAARDNQLLPGRMLPLAEHVP